MNTTSLINPRAYISAYFYINNVKINPKGDVEGKKLKDQVFSTLWLDYMSQVVDFRSCEAAKPKAERQTLFAINESDMRKAMDEFLDIEKEKALEIIKESIKCEKEDLEPISLFVEGMTGSRNPANLAVMAHWLWLVKQKLIKGKWGNNHIMPIFLGKQEGGKSSCVKQLIAPISKISLTNYTFDMLSDEKLGKVMGLNYIAVFDEMKGAAKADINVLKNKITATTTLYRPMRTNESVEVPQHCSFIGTTNNAVNEQIKDTTGMRRFFEIKTLDTVNWSIIESLDFLALWKGIDENRVNGYFEQAAAEIKLKQSLLVEKDHLHIFLEEKAYSLPQKGDIEAVYIQKGELYRSYSLWLSCNGYLSISAKAFGTRLMNIGFEEKQIRNGKQRDWCWSIKMTQEV